MARPGAGPRTHSRRSHELFAAFNGPTETDPALPDYTQASAAAASSAPRSASRPSTDVFFDAGDALPEPDAQSNNVSASDPLGANRASASSARSPSSFRPPPTFARNPATPAYDFERPEYFPTATRRPPPSSNATSPRPHAATHAADPASNNHHHTIDLGAETQNEGDDSTHSGSGSNLHRNGYTSLPTSSHDSSGGTSTHASEHVSRSDRLRFALGRFGRFVGMGIPGARYSSLSQQDGARAGVHRPRVVGGGVGQDGVFANLSAKPERRRRGHNSGGTDDRGDDDDLEDDIQPPTYEIAAADAVPQYWETTILGGSVHPLANGLGWTPGGAHVGAIEDLIVEGLAVGNLFGFAWNLLVSMTFQFVGFLLTYLLHTTHAARCGSRAGLGITLIQYGFYLRTRASEIAEGKIIDQAGFSGGGAVSPGAAGAGWFGEDSGENGARRRAWSSRTVQPAQPTLDGTTLADLFAAQADGQPVNVGDQSIADSMSQSTEWLAYVLMVIGWTILLSSMLSYWRIWRWGKSLVDAARREQESSDNNDSANDASAGTTQASGATSFVSRFRSVFSSRRRPSGGTGEDWVLFPGVGHRLGRSAGRRSRQARSTSFDHPTSIADLEDEEGLDTEEARLNPAERRLLNDMRRVGLA